MDYENLCKLAQKVDPKIRFAGIINYRGKLIAGGMVTGKKALEDEKKDEMLFMELALRVKMRSEFNNFLIKYYKQLSDTWTNAQKEVASKTTKIPPNEEGTEAYKRVWIDIFENNFTGLFDSKKFSENYNNLVSTELDLLKRWNTITDVMLKSANLPTKEEIEEIYEELHILKNRIAKLELSKKQSEKNVRK